MCQNCSKELAKTYDPKGIEGRLYKKWEDNGYFHAEVDRSKKPFTIVMPPPNITGQLHMGHALDNTMQDILIRYKRMQGYNALWQPGTDHASIATEVKVIENLKKQGIDKHDLGREGFLEKCYEWKDEYGSRIINQLKKMGSSADWQRERFTMDKGCSDAVLEVFVKLYEKGLIYKGSRIVNWCPVCKTSISDAEVEHEEQDGFFWHINYPVVGEEGRFVEIATTRPETLFGDTAVAVNPDDERYKDIVGKMLKLPMTDREIPVIADPYVDKEFGTGCVKITPAHDPNDFEVGKRHNLEEITVINDDATMNHFAGKYEGMDRYECRKALVDDLKEQGLLVKVEPHSHNVGTHDRCGTTVEPMVKQQWFVKMDELIKPAVEAVKNGDIQLLPKRMEKTYFNWTDNIRDWCISRQLWWGHRIPAYYCPDCGEMVVAKSAPQKCPKCGCGHMEQDPDTLDTWFSSALWPFSTLGWPKKTEDLDYFFPTDVLVTGYDIIFFWVIRMIFSGYEQMGKAPFHTVLFHGLVRDSQGRKMSKSLGNGIDPLEVIDKYGADAIRWYFYTTSAPWLPSRYSEKAVREGQNKFLATLQNVYAFFAMYADIDNFDPTAHDLKNEQLSLMDKWILSKLNTLIKRVDDDLWNYRVTEPALAIQDFVDELSNWYVRRGRERFWGKGDVKDKDAAFTTLYHVLVTLSKVCAPFIPFLSEEIYQNLVVNNVPGAPESVHLCDFPTADESAIDADMEAQMDALVEVVQLGRACRNLANIKTRQTAAKLYVKGASFSESYQALCEDELNVKEVVFTESAREFTTYQLKPQMRTLGPKYGKLLGKIC